MTVNLLSSTRNNIVWEYWYGMGNCHFDYINMHYEAKVEKLDEQNMNLAMNMKYMIVIFFST